MTWAPTLSPGTASCKASWCISTDFTSVVIPAGAKVTTQPGFKTPVSTRPTGTVPIPPILYTSCNGNRSGLSVGRVGGSCASKACNKVLPSNFCPFRSIAHPLNQVILVDGSNMLSPFQPEIGTKATVAGL
ncbi:hypothetical protein DERP_015402 [Dermatophagoides pteronyssinus]|uniref:Uncharacterized protein n=1 Tax=Dermatophagoides pteronyssinus TaxID=6956 RepID=A0ABQ8JBF0_DERPT|nr:hypothetical protein DERP_015402 [Dermatophagoides pteronyssinus]